MDSRSQRRLTVDFKAWIENIPSTTEPFFRNGLVVLDANILLDLYRVTPDARVQVLNVIRYVSDRLWVPHQAAIEFSRNRRQVVIDRTSWFKSCQNALENAPGRAIDILETAISQLKFLRETTGTTRVWDPDVVDLTREKLLERLSGAMDPALLELSTLKGEHDLHPGDMQETDIILTEIDELLAGKIGDSYSSDTLRALVEDALEFRFPNKIPPGFEDLADKGNKLRAAGDYILWRQTIDRVNKMPPGKRLVMLITKDFKRDWWTFDRKNRPKGPLPELIQEMRDSAGADLLLLSLKDFLTGAEAHLSTSIAEQTLVELDKITKHDDSMSNIADDDILYRRVRSNLWPRDLVSNARTAPLAAVTSTRLGDGIQAYSKNILSDLGLSWEDLLPSSKDGLISFPAAGLRDLGFEIFTLNDSDHPAHTLIKLPDTFSRSPSTLRLLKMRLIEIASVVYAPSAS
jgi:hypothetical protein